MQQFQLSDEDIAKLQNARKPSDTIEGRQILERMNSGHHAQLSEWGMPFLTFDATFDALDLGCGGGANVARMLGYCPQGTVTGLDYSPMSIEVSNQTNADAIAAGRCKIVLGDVGDMPFDDGSFDVITAFETVYFWPEPKQAFREALRVCRGGGAFMVVHEADGLDEQGLFDASVIKGMTVYTAGQIADLMLQAGFCDVECHHDAVNPWIAVVGHKRCE